MMDALTATMAVSIGWIPSHVRIYNNSVLVACVIIRMTYLSVVNCMAIYFWYNVFVGEEVYALKKTYFLISVTCYIVYIM